MEIFPGNLEEVGCVSEAIETFPGDLEGFRCVFEAIETFPCDLEGLRCVSEAMETIPVNFDFPLDVSTSKDVIASLDEGVNWVIDNSASIFIFANCLNSTKLSALQISSSI